MNSEKEKQVKVDNVSEKLTELIHVAVNLRFAQKYWHEHFGSNALNQRKRWEARMDTLLIELGQEGHLNTKASRLMRDDQGNFTKKITQ